ncbi:MAG: Gfo/Idh/MocA family oxidoreductase, partial [Gemmatimonadales bacterium]
MSRVTPDPLRVGLVGCGRAAERIYLPAFGRVPGAGLAAVSDPNTGRRALVARAAGAPDFADVEEMLTRCELDAVVVAAPPEVHAPIAEAALRHSLAVLVEKPLAPDLVGARRIADAAAEAGRPVMVGFNRRRLPAVVRLRELLEPVDRSALEFDSEFHALPAAWDPVAGVRDPIDDLASHHLDLFQFLAGSEIAWVSAERRGQAIELVVRLESGANGRCVVSQGQANRERLAVSVRDEAEGRGGAPDSAGADSRWWLRPSSDRLGPA